MVDVNLGNVRGLQGLPGATGNGIRSIEKTGTSGKVDTYTITYDNGSTKTFTVTNGSDGSTVSFTRTLSSGTKLGTITINGVSTDLYCNSGGSTDIVTSWEQLLSDAKVPSEKLTKNTIDTKQDVLVSGTNIKTVNGNSIMGSGDLEVGSNAGTFTDLQGLIDDADSGDIIVLDKDYKYNSTTDSSLSDGVVINKIITLIGNGHIIDANNSRKAFSINDSQYGLTLIDLVIQNGSNIGESGGAIYNEGTLIISDCHFRNNIADSAGAIYTANGSVLNISNSSFMYNTANGEHTGGGAIKSYGDLTITNSVFTLNEAYECGAIDNRSTFSLKNSTVKSNDATYHANIYSASPVIAYGCDLSDGASTYTNITNKPYLTGVEVGSFTDLQTLITSASSGDTLILDKDYQYDSTTDSSLTNGVTISEDITIIGNGHIIDGNNSKKAFYINGQYTVNLYDLRIQNCSGSYGGAIHAGNGAIVNINNTQFTNNTATGTYGYGGAIYATSATVNITNTTFNQNNANQLGGAIYAIQSATVNINNTQFKQNTSNGDGGAIYASYVTVNLNNTTFNQNNATYRGGAIDARATGTIRNSSFQNNTATTYNDIYFSTEITVYDCIIPNIATTCYNVTNITTESLSTSKQNTLVSGTNIKTINNESILGSGNITVSGGVSTGTFTELQSLITSASSGDIITLTKDYQYDSTTDSSISSGVVIDKTLTINANGHIIDGNASARAFTMTGASNTPITLNLTNIIIQNCKTTDNGGAIYANTYANLTINNSLFTRNESRIGGAIYIYSHGILTITNSTFTYNKTTGSNCYGGAINANSYCTVLIEESIFTNNSTTTRGGVIYGASSTNTTINNSILTNNTASEGGALSFRNLGSSTKLKMSGTSVYGNTASTSANIYCSASMTVYNCVLSDTASTYYNVTNYDDVSSENIVDNLTTDDATKVLSAKQGKVISDMIGSAITYIVGSGS